MINNKLIYDCPLISIAELADMLHISKSCLYHDIYKSKHENTPPMIKHIKIGGRIFYRSRDIQDMIDDAINRPLRVF